MGYVSTTFLSLEEAASRCGTYRLLARLWLREVDLVVLQELCRPPLRDTFVAAGGILPPDDSGATIENLAIAYCKLFVGPANHLPPFQSVWQDGQFQGAVTASMREMIEIVGYDVDRLPGGVMLDHFGVQLNVMGHILDIITSWPSDAESLGPVWELANTFFAAHLLWPTDMLEAAMRLADDDFYRSTIMLTREFLKSEIHAQHP
jgi:TorA maturation chaperone TorD